VAASSRVIYEAADTRVTVTEGRLVFERRTTFLLGLGAGVLGLGLGFSALARWGGAEALLPGSFLYWTGTLMVVLGGLNLLLGLGLALWPATAVDPAAGTLVAGLRRIPLSELDGIDVVETHFGGRTLVRLVARSRQGPVRLLGGQDASRRAEVEAVATQVRAALGLAGGTSPAVTHAARAFPAALLLTLGTLWAASGRLMAPDLVLTVPQGSVGFRLWPFGLWLVALGAMELLGFQVHSTLVGSWSRHRVLLFVVVMGSYALVCWTRVAG